MFVWIFIDTASNGCTRRGQPIWFLCPVAKPYLQFRFLVCARPSPPCLICKTLEHASNFYHPVGSRNKIDAFQILSYTWMKHQQWKLCANEWRYIPFSLNIWTGRCDNKFYSFSMQTNHFIYSCLCPTKRMKFEYSPDTRSNKARKSRIIIIIVIEL